MTALGAFVSQEWLLEAWFSGVILLIGLATGSLALLMIGHLLSEHWLEPIRDEVEGAALTLPALLVLAVPIAFSLDALYPWARPAALDLPPGRAAYLSPGFFLARSAGYLVTWTCLAIWLARTRKPRRASAIGFAILAPTMMLAANDWVLSREPQWWSSLFGFAFAASQMLAALAGAILIALSKPGHGSASRMLSLERALLTLALLTLWTWFVQFLIVWLADLPPEASWYLARGGDRLWLLLAGAVPALLLAIVILVPPGVGRGAMMVGSGLVLVHHGPHMLWIMRPESMSRAFTFVDLVVWAGLGMLWAAWFGFAVRSRPASAPETGEPRSEASRPLPG